MSTPRDHHFIPAFYLEQWTGPNGKLIEYTIKHGKLISKSVGPRSTGYETDLYTFPELPHDARQHLEQVFWNYTDRTASLAFKLHLSGNATQWNNELICAWSRFVLGIRLRHPDSMLELRAAAQAIWDASGVDFQSEYERLRELGDPATFDDYLAVNEPMTPIKARVNMIIKVFDHAEVGQHITRMRWATLDVSTAPVRLLLSDRPVEFSRIKEIDGIVSLPISPTKLFVAVNNVATLENLRNAKPGDIVCQANMYVVERARRFVWAQDESQKRFIQNRMSTKMEPKPLFPSIAPSPKKSST
jgi:hypothetical protein